MARRKAPAPLRLSAPDLTGPVSLLDWPLTRPSGRTRRRPRAMEHVHLEVDLLPGMERTSRIPGLHQLEEALREAEVTEEGDLLWLVGGALEAFASVGFRRVDHWEVRPGGWLPLRRVPIGPQVEPVRQFLDALRLDDWKSMAGARELAARLSSPRGDRLELVARRVHRERQHSLTLDLHGVFGREDVHGLVAALHRRLPVLRSQVTAFRFVGDVG